MSYLGRVFYKTRLILLRINGSIEAFTFLVDKGADLNLQDISGNTACSTLCF